MPEVKFAPGWKKWLGTIFLASAALLVAGCNRSSDAPVAVAPERGKPPVKLEEAPILSEEDSALVKANSVPASEADRAWRDLQQAMKLPGYPAEWENTPPTKEQVAEFEKKNGLFVAQGADKARLFYTKYPTNENAPEARRREYDLLRAAIDLGNTNVVARIEALEQERLKDPTLSSDERIGLRVQQTAVRSLQAEYPDRNDLASLSMSLAELWLEQGDFQKSRALAEEVLKAKPEDEVKQNAQDLVKKVSRVGKPLEIKFSALDGREVDLQKLKGKVVLVDFWATWCVPCMRGLPEVKAAYEKLHDKGFEIVGISYDDKKEALQRVISAENVPWPQSFDEVNGGKKFAEEFGVTTLPNMWLVDKQGLLRDLRGTRDLSAKVEKLLADK
jgi:thiol-disulfide isomerase/thioredoxin